MSDKQHEARLQAVPGIEGTFIAYFGAARKFIAESTAEIKKLRADADYKEKWVKLELDAMQSAWDGSMARSLFPVEGGSVVPYTRRISPDELELFVGNDELVNITVAPDGRMTTCYFGPLDDSSGLRTCYLCRRRARVAAEHVDVSVLPDEVPAHIAAIIAGKEILVDNDEPETADD